MFASILYPTQTALKVLYSSINFSLFQIAYTLYYVVGPKVKKSLSLSNEDHKEDQYTNALRDLKIEWMRYIHTHACHFY